MTIEFYTSASQNWDWVWKRNWIEITWKIFKLWLKWKSGKLAETDQKLKIIEERNRILERSNAVRMTSNNYKVWLMKNYVNTLDMQQINRYTEVMSKPNCLLTQNLKNWQESIPVRKNMHDRPAEIRILHGLPPHFSLLFLSWKAANFAVNRGFSARVFHAIWFTLRLIFNLNFLRHRDSRHMACTEATMLHLVSY